MAVHWGTTARRMTSPSLPWPNGRRRGWCGDEEYGTSATTTLRRVLPGGPLPGGRGPHQARHGRNRRGGGCAGLGLSGHGPPPPWSGRSGTNVAEQSSPASASPGRAKGRGRRGDRAAPPRSRRPPWGLRLAKPGVKEKPLASAASLFGLVPPSSARATSRPTPPSCRHGRYSPSARVPLFLSVARGTTLRSECGGESAPAMARAQNRSGWLAATRSRDGASGAAERGPAPRSAAPLAPSRLRVAANQRVSRRSPFSLQPGRCSILPFALLFLPPRPQPLAPEYRGEGGRGARPPRLTQPGSCNLAAHTLHPAKDLLDQRGHLIDLLGDHVKAAVRLEQVAEAIDEQPGDAAVGEVLEDWPGPRRNSAPAALPPG